MIDKLSFPINEAVSKRLIVNPSPELPLKNIPEEALDSRFVILVSNEDEADSKSVILESNDDEADSKSVMSPSIVVILESNEDEADSKSVILESNDDEADSKSVMSPSIVVILESNEDEADSKSVMSFCIIVILVSNEDEADSKLVMSPSIVIISFSIVVIVVVIEEDNELVAVSIAPLIEDWNPVVISNLAVLNPGLVTLILSLPESTNSIPSVTWKVSPLSNEVVNANSPVPD